MDGDRWPERPRLGRTYYKAHGLGNDYLVFEEGDDWQASPELVAAVCHPHRGVGSDGLVALLRARDGGAFHARMFNPDGTEFERSGNGLRVLGSHLARRGEASPYRISVGGDVVGMAVRLESPGRYDVSLEMGRAGTGPAAVGLDPDALADDGRLEGPHGELLTVVPVSVGNPHLVVLTPEVTGERLAELGPYLVAHPALARGANVQLADATGDGRCRALVWERGVGPTAASGTSACAVAVALVTTGRLREGEVTVDMPGGSLGVVVAPGPEVTLRGPVEEVCEGELASVLVGGA